MADAAAPRRAGALRGRPAHDGAGGAAAGARGCFHRAPTQAAGRARPGSRVLRPGGVQQLLRRHRAGGLLSHPRLEPVGDAPGPLGLAARPRHRRAGLRPDGLLAGSFLLSSHAGQPEHRCGTGQLVVGLPGAGFSRRVCRAELETGARPPGARLAGLRLRRGPVLQPECAGPILLQVPRGRRARAHGAGTRSGPHPDRGRGAALAVDAPAGPRVRVVAAAGGRPPRADLIQHQPALRAARLADPHSRSESPAESRVPPHGMDRPQPARGAQRRQRFAALLVQRVARPCAARRRLGTGPVEPKCGLCSVGARAGGSPRAFRTLDAVPRRGRGECARSEFEGAVPRSCVPA